jgi:hypothetical protein
MADDKKLKEYGFEPDPADYGFELDGQSSAEDFLNASADPMEPGFFEPGSKTDSFQKGAEQGLTLGTADEGRGFISAGMDAGQALLNKLGLMGPSPTQVNEQLAKDGFTGDVGPQSVLEAYQQARDSARKEYQAAQEANPMTSFAGNMAGGLLLGGGAGALAKGGSTAGQIASKVMNPIAANPNAALLQKMATGAVNAAPTAAIAAGGLSQADLTKGEVGQFATDVATDTGLGMGLGALLPAAAAGMKNTTEAIKKTDTAQDLMDAYRAAKKGIKLSGQDALKSQAEGLENLAMDARKSTTQFGADKAAAKRAILEEAEKSGKSADIKELLQKFADDIGTNKSLSTEDTQRLNKIVESYFKGGSTKSPLELEAMLREVTEMNPDFMGPGYRIIKSLKEGLRNVQNKMDDRIAPINKDITENLALSENMLGQSNLDKMLPEEIPAFLNKNSKKFQKYQTDTTGVQLDMDKVLNEGLPTDFGSKTRSMKELNPDFANKFETDLKGQSRLFDLSKKANTNMAEGIGNKGIIAGATKAVQGGAVKIGEAAGKVVKDNKEFLQKGINMLSNADGNKLQQLGARMAKQGGKAAEFARVLNEAASKNPQSKNAIIFGLMQQPEFREIFHKANDESAEPEDGQ